MNNKKINGLDNFFETPENALLAMLILLAIFDPKGIEFFAERGKSTDEE